MKTEHNLSLDVYIDHIVDMYYWSFDYMNRKLSRARIKDIIKYNIIGNYLYDHTNLCDEDVCKKYIFIAIIKFLSFRNYEHIDYEIHTLRGKIQTLLFKEQAKRLADTFIDTKNEERTFNEFKTFIKKDFITNFISYK